MHCEHCFFFPLSVLQWDDSPLLLHNLQEKRFLWDYQNAHTVSLLELKTARSLVSYIINRQSWLHWETLICIYSVFIQKTFDRDHKTQHKLGQLWSSCSNEWRNNTSSDSMKSTRKTSFKNKQHLSVTLTWTPVYLYLLRLVITLLAKKEKTGCIRAERKTCFIRILMTQSAQS